MKQIVISLLALFLLAGCEDDDHDWGPNSEGNYKVLVINNLNDEIDITYKQEPGIDLLDIVTDGGLSTYSQKSNSIPAHGEAKIKVYFTDWGTGIVTAMWDGKEKVYYIPYEYRTVATGPEHFE